MLAIYMFNRCTRFFLQIHIFNSCLNNKPFAQNTDKIVSVNIHRSALASVLPCLNYGVLFGMDGAAGFIHCTRWDIMFNTVTIPKLHTGYNL